MRKTAALIFVCISFFSSGLFGQIVPFGSPGWKYFHQLPAAAPCSEPPNYASTSSFSWKSPQYNTVAVPGWVNNSDTLPMGYAVNTSNIYGGLPIKKILTFNDPAAKPTTLYIRRTITLTSFSRASYSSFTLRLRADDGVRVYFNETEVANYNLPSGTLGANISASSAIGTDTTSKVFQIPNTFPQHPESPDKITITAEIHQSTVGLTPNCSTNSSDLFIDMQLSGILSNMPASLTRGPYLQIPHPHGMQVRWKTNIPTNSLVKYKLTSSQSFVDSVILNDMTTDHIVNITGLSPNSTYHYTIGYFSNTPVKLQGSDTNRFITPPLEYTPGKTTRIWATGDCGADSLLLLARDYPHSSFKSSSADFKQRLVKNNFLNFINAQNIDLDLWLLLGDNAYDYGTEADLQKNFFDIYGNTRIMKQTPIAPATGNHEFYPQNGFSKEQLRENKNIDYFKVFSMDSSGLAGGYHSGNKGYYSYNYNNIHFVSLDSYGKYGSTFKEFFDTTSLNAQFSWLKEDLNRNTQKWTILYWHHSPYTRGRGHNSDSLVSDEYIMYYTRERLIKFLDNKKVDLILTGHSHSYERSKLLKGHYGESTSYVLGSDTASYPIYSNNNSNARYESSSTCPYIKKSDLILPNEGIVYVVSGSAGWLENPLPNPSNHPVMKYSNMTQGGSVYLEITDNRLDGKWIDEGGGIGDKFTIFKDVNKNDILVDSISFSEFPSETPQLQILKPNWPKVTNFTVTGPNGYSQTFQNAAISISNPQIGPIYTVKDQYNCLTQNFRFNFSNQCWRDITINNTFDTSVIQNINSSGTISSGSKIIGTSKVNFNAAHGIFLTPGIFNAEKNSVFSGKVQPSPCQ